MMLLAGELLLSGPSAGGGVIGIGADVIIAVEEAEVIIAPDEVEVIVEVCP